MTEREARADERSQAVLTMLTTGTKILRWLLVVCITMLISLFAAKIADITAIILSTLLLNGFLGIR